MTLSAQSVSGKSGAGAPVEVTLPQRLFHNPLARALVEQRRDLILDPDQAPEARRDGAGRLERRARTVRHAGQHLSRPEAGEDLARQRPRRRRPARSRGPVVGDGPADRGRRFHAGRARTARRGAGAARGAPARRERRRDQETDADPARGGAEIRQRDGEERRPEPGRLAGAGAGSRQADGSHGGRCAQRHARRSRGDARSDAGDVREHAQLPRRRREPGRKGDEEADRRARETATRSAGAARRHVPQRSARPQAETRQEPAVRRARRSGAAAGRPGSGGQRSGLVRETGSGRRTRPTTRSGSARRRSRTASPNCSAS